MWPFDFHEFPDVQLTSHCNPRYHNWWLIGDITREPPFPLIQRPNLWQKRMIYEKDRLFACWNRRGNCDLSKIFSTQHILICHDPSIKKILIPIIPQPEMQTSPFVIDDCLIHRLSYVYTVLCDYFWWFWNDCPYLLYLYISIPNHHVWDL